MKKVFIWITALPLLLLGGGLGLPALAASEPVVHSWSDWTMDRPPSCTEAGSKSRHCIYCQAEDAPLSIPALGHQFGAWVLDQSPDCSQSGAQHRSCSRCGIAQTETLKPLGHRYGAWKMNPANTCTQDGQALRTCSLCQAQEVERSSATGHTWSAWREFGTISCTEERVRMQRCSVCAQSAQVIVPAKGHAFGSWEETEPSCIENGYRQRTCSSCGEPEAVVLSALGHHYASDWTVDAIATCTEEGRFSHRCELCGEKQDETIVPPLGHQYLGGSGTDGNPAVCQRCGNPETTKTNEQLYSALVFLNVLLASGFAVWIVPDVKTLLWYKHKKQAFLKKVGK